ncbi:MAG: START domain-containing protein [Chthoniobacteraceae bacterium]
MRMRDLPRGTVALIDGRMGTHISPRSPASNPVHWGAIPCRGAALAIAIAAWVLTSVSGARAADEEPWKLVKRGAEVTIYERVQSDSSLKEYRAIGAFAASPEVIKGVLDDIELYPQFMPFVKVARILSDNANSRVTYQRVSPPLIGDRDYVIETTCETNRLKSGGFCYVNSWQCVPEKGPAEKKGVVRVKVTHGSWRLEPGKDGGTLGTYTVFSDPQVKMPPLLVNSAAKSAIPRIFTAIAKQSKNSKYQVP